MASPQEQLEALVGAALKILVEGDASSSLVGAFALRYPKEVAQALGLASSTPEVVDLYQVVKEAVQEALQSHGNSTTSDRSAPDPGPRGARRVVVRLRGKRTTLSISSKAFAAATQLAGGTRVVFAAIKTLAHAAPATENRSRWVSQRLLSTLQANLGEQAPGQATH